MSRRANATFPVRELRDQITELEAAALEVLHKPKKKAVHRIRTSTRRIEAQMELLDALAPGNPTLRLLGRRAGAEHKARRTLTRLRKSAGRVRDLDVQRDLVKEAVAHSRNEVVQADAKDLNAWLKRRRAEEAQSFHAQLAARRDQLAARLESVLAVCARIDDLSLTETQLIRATESWFEQSISHDQPPKSVEDHLHTIRKNAKLARYIAESGSQSMHRAHALAAKFEDLQGLGGQWHDLLILSKLARKHLGRKSELVLLLARQEVRLREEFRSQLFANKWAPPGA